MRLKSLELNGFKSFAKKTVLDFEHPIVSIVGPNGSGKSNVVEALRFVLGEQSMKSMRGSSGTDMIFKGSKNLPKSVRASVSVYFNNNDKVFKISNDEGENVSLNYDIVSVSREVYSDGLNKYILNGSDVRLKDIHTLLSSVNIGASQHHIISQGEADRVLNANSKDRREMVEEALGLKIYQYRIKESARKLEKTEMNMKEVSMLRRENAPHLNFLKRQMEKLEKAKEMRDELSLLYREYLKKESLYIENEKSVIAFDKKKLSFELENIETELRQMDAEGGKGKEESEKEKEIKILEKKRFEINGAKGEIERKLGRIEAMIEIGLRDRSSEKQESFVSRERISVFLRDMSIIIDDAILKDDLSEIKSSLFSISDNLKKFKTEIHAGDTEQKDQNEIENFKNTKKQIEVELEKIRTEEKNIFDRISVLKEEARKESESLHLKEKDRFNMRMKKQELVSALDMVRIKEDNLRRQIDAFENEIKEGSVLIGGDVLLYRDFNLDDSYVLNKMEQEEQKRKIEKIKIRLEDTGLDKGLEITKEYKEVTERDAFLAKEMEDLSRSIESIRVLMADLKEKIDTEFKEGLKKINIEFNNFFNLMFGGGSAHLSLVLENKKSRKSNLEENADAEIDTDEEEIVFEQGVDIDVSLPQKKVKELNALSGGERSLTSIALLFAMSQVNPPPFLVLDETDAALDEANSRKYGDMLERLSKHSQLVVITHNRETMSRAGILYGVTIGADGASKLLSVKLDEAQAIAK